MTDQSTSSDLDEYLREAGSWADDRRLGDRRTVRIAWWIAGIAAVIALVEAFALAALAPLKTVLPMAVLVDRQTGAVTMVDPNGSTDISPDSALTRSMLAQYVIARETIDRASVREDYRKAVLWSGGTARTQYLAQMKPGNPANPYLSAPATMIVQPVIRSVTALEDGSALVRFDKVTQGVGAQGSSQPFVALMRYAYRKRNLSEADRLTNPLGFEVTSYRRDAEAPAAVQTVVAQPTVPSAAQTEPSAAQTEPNGQQP